MISLMLIPVIFLWFFFGVRAAEALEAGTYTADVDLSGLSMGGSAFTKTVSIEREDDRYYLTFGHSSSVSDLVLHIEDKQVGFLKEIREDWTYYTYTVSKENLEKDLSFTCMVNAMKMEVSFTIRVDFSSLRREADTIRDLGERPAEFVPVIQTAASAEYEMSVNSTFIFPELTASIGDVSCIIARSIQYNGTELEDVADKLLLDKTGTYLITYQASSSLYKTSLGKDTYTNYTIQITVSSDGGGIARYEDIHGILGTDVSLMAGRISEDSSVYSLASKQMAEISDHYELFSVSIIDSRGNDVSLSDTIRLYLTANPYYDRTKAVVYHLDGEGNLTRLSTHGYGRYVFIETDMLGTFAVCIPGVAFVMPMWGYILICVGVLLVLAAMTVTIVLVVKKRKQRKALPTDK